MKLKRILVLTSGRGSNFRALLEASRHGVLRAEIVALGVSKRDCGAVQIGESAKLPVLFEPNEAELSAFFHREKLDAVVLAGFMKILSPEFIQGLRDERGLSRIINIHPSLLPAFPGLNAYRQAFEHGVRETGVTIHLVEPAIDSGPILDQRSFRIDHFKSAEDVEARGLPVEHELYARTVDWYLAGDYRLENRGGKTHVSRP